MLNLGSIRLFVLHSVFLSSVIVAMTVAVPVWAGMLCGKSKVVESERTVVAHLDELPSGKTQTVPGAENTEHSAVSSHSHDGSPVQ